MYTDKRHALQDVMSCTNINITTNSNFLSWKEFQDLKQTPQDPEWHAEGDVLIHTEMVLNECLKFNNSTYSLDHDLSDRQLQLLNLAALFHDISKPGTTRYDEELKHTIAPGHERIGGIKSRQMLRELSTDITNEERRLISQLVSTHHLVKRSVKKFEANDVDAVSYLERLASRVDTKLLWALEMADMKGRICVEQSKQVEFVEFFRMLCEENNVFGKAPIPWFSNKEINDVHFENDSVAEYGLAEMHRRRLLGLIKNEYQGKAFLHEVARTRKNIPLVIFPIGVSGSGKSKMYNSVGKHLIKISPDSQRELEYGDESSQESHGRIYQACTEQLKDVLRTGGQAYFDATNVIPDLRSKLVNICHDYGAEVHFLVFDISMETLKKRNLERSRKVPEVVIERQMSKFEWPLPEESHKVVVIDE